MDISQELKTFKARIDPEIAAYFEHVITEAHKEDALVVEALEAAKDLALAGGKRLRPAFLAYTYQACGGTEAAKILKTAVSVELLHLFLLVHDDIIDRDDVRHGIPTLHRRYAEIGKTYFPHQDTEHFGLSIALIMGDMLMAFGNDIIFRSEFPHDRIFRALSLMQRIVTYTVIGQGRDIFFEYQRSGSEEEILQMYRNKTARYTVEGPMQIGAALAGASERDLVRVSQYALPIGVAFQIRDDILGIFGAADTLGKPVGSDIEEGKLTLLVSCALKRGSGVQRKELERILTLGSAMTMADIERSREIIRETGSLAYSQETMRRFVDQGRSALLDLSFGTDTVTNEFFLSVAEYLTEREY